LSSREQLPSIHILCCRYIEISQTNHDFVVHCDEDLFEGYSALAEDFGIGTADDSFHFWGILPLVIDRLKSSVKAGVIETAVPLGIFPEIPSGPEALLVSKAFNKFKTFCSVQRISSGADAKGSSMKHCRSNSLNGGKVLLKFLEKT